MKKPLKSWIRRKFTKKEISVEDSEEFKKIPHQIVVRNIMWAISNKPQRFIEDVYGSGHDSAYLNEKTALVIRDPIFWFLGLDSYYAKRATEVANSYYS